MTSEEKELSLALYKEAGLEVRQFHWEVYVTNRLMLPPLVIGLLVLYGEVEKFIGVEIKNPEAVHQVVWFGCVIISLIWIFNVSRLAQLAQWHRETVRDCESKLGLEGHKKIAKTDEESTFSKILRHSILRFIGFGIYSALLLTYILKSMNFNFLNETSISLIAILGSAVVPFLIWRFYFKNPPTSSRKNLIKFQYIIAIIALLILCLLLFLYLVDLQKEPEVPEVKVHLMSGLEFSEKGDYDNAIASYTKAIEIKRDYAKAYALRGEAYRAKGEDDQSNKDWGIVNALRKAQ